MISFASQKSINSDCSWLCLSGPEPVGHDASELPSPPSGSNLTFESALDCLLTNAHDKAGHAAIRTVRRWVVLPIADLAWRLHLWCGVTLSREGGVSAALLCRPA